MEKVELPPPDKDEIEMSIFYQDNTVCFEATSTEMSTPVENNINGSEETFAYKENDLFHFLNDKENLMGNILLAEYAESKRLDHSTLKELIVIRELKLDPINYKIESEQFIRITEQIEELFPTEDKQLFFIPYCADGNESRSARGCLYNYYKCIRRRLRTAGILQVKLNEEKNDTSIEANTSNLNCLTDEHREGYDVVDVLRQWSDSFFERSKLLIQKKNDKSFIETYFKSFPCIRNPIGIMMLESDFLNIIEEFETKKQLQDDSSIPYKTKMTCTWAIDSKKIMHYCKTSKVKEIKDFYKEHKDLVKEDTHNSILALLLLPLYLTVPKNIKIEKKLSKNFNKIDISKSFILHVQDPAKIIEEKASRNDWLRSNNQVIYPYVIICGEVKNISQSILVLNGENYYFSDPVKAVETCFKCLLALRTFPYLCDHLWSFIAKFVYGITCLKSYAAVNKLIVELKKIKIIEEKTPNESSKPKEQELLMEVDIL